MVNNETLREIVKLLKLIPVEAHGCYDSKLDERIQKMIERIEMEIDLVDEF